MDEIGCVVVIMVYEDKVSAWERTCSVSVELRRTSSSRVQLLS